MNNARLTLTMARARPMIRAMNPTKPKREQRTRTGKKGQTEPPWNIILHNEWENSLLRVISILKKTIPGMTYSKSTKIAWEAHTSGRAVVKRCHKELAELYKERLQGEGLTVSLEPAR